MRMVNELSRISPFDRAFHVFGRDFNSDIIGVSYGYGTHHRNEVIAEGRGEQ